MEPMDDVEAAESGYAVRVGTRLRAIRKQKRLSLQDVEAASNQEFKASVLGAYERGERAISVPRLHRLARFYNVPVDQLLPPNGHVIDLDAEAAGQAAAASAPPVEDEGGITIDLVKLEHLDGEEASLLSRYLGAIQVQRGDFNGRVLTIRRDDLRAIGALLDTTPDLARRRLDERGLRKQM